MLQGVPIVVPDDGLPNADDIMARGVLLPLSHAIDDDTLDYVLQQCDEFLSAR
jgi:dTDP-4-amino-4,6-dideoxygalactose transaminase